MAKKIDYASMFTLRKDGRYQGSWTDAAGKRHFAYDRDPEVLFYKIEDAQKPKMLTFGELAEAWREEHVSKLERGTQQTYKAPLEQAINRHGSFELANVTAEEINKVMLTEKAQGYSLKHAATMRSMYKQVFDYAIVNGLAASNPAMAVKAPRGLKKGRREAPEDDAYTLIKMFPDLPFGLFPLVLLYTGFRTEEAAALQWGDIDEKQKVIYCRRAVDLHGTPRIKTTKTEAGDRMVPLLNGLAEHLKKPAGAKPKDYIFCNDSGKLLTRSKITNRWLNWCKQVGMAEQITVDGRHRGARECQRTEWRATLTPHQLRHGYATMLLEAGVDEVTAMNLMGHADITTTRAIYTHLRQQQRDKATGALNKQFDSL